MDAFATKNGVPVQDLKADDFEIFEDGAPQKIENFEQIVIEPTPSGGRVDPSSIDQAIQLAADPHRRVFVVYLDTGNVDFAGRHDITEPLIDFMNRVMSDDDLLGLMTPEIGYYTTNAKLDGRYRTIKVRSTRPGVEVRARQGYRRRRPRKWMRRARLPMWRSRKSR